MAWVIRARTLQRSHLRSSSSLTHGSNTSGAGALQIDSGLYVCLIPKRFFHPKVKSAVISQGFFFLLADGVLLIKQLTENYMQLEVETASLNLLMVCPYYWNTLKMSCCCLIYKSSWFIFKGATWSCFLLWCGQHQGHFEVQHSQSLFLRGFNKPLTWPSFRNTKL